MHFESFEVRKIQNLDFVVRENVAHFKVRSGKIIGFVKVKVRESQGFFF